MKLKDEKADIVSLEEELAYLKSRKQALQDVLKEHKTKYFVVKIPIPV
jgi:hypothetical protein